MVRLKLAATNIAKPVRSTRADTKLRPSTPRAEPMPFVIEIPQLNNDSRSLQSYASIAADEGFTRYF